jgi:serine/threonine-protein kinase RsbW
MHMHGSSNGRGKGKASGASPTPTRLTFRIGSTYEEARAVQGRIMDEIAARTFGEGDVFAIRLALEEAVINAIKHGNKLDPAKQVSIEAEISDAGVDIKVQDEGAGFNRDDVPDPTLDENLDKNSGRGILLIESYMTGAKWSDHGRRLHMFKRREPAMAEKN